MSAIYIYSKKEKYHNYFDNRKDEVVILKSEYDPETVNSKRRRFLWHYIALIIDLSDDFDEQIGNSIEYLTEKKDIIVELIDLGNAFDAYLDIIVGVGDIEEGDIRNMRAPKELVELSHTIGLSINVQLRC